MSAVWKQLKVVPSSRVAQLEVYCQGAGGPTVLKDRELVEWQAGDLLENLHYQLYDEGRRLLPLSLVTASKMKVSVDPAVLLCYRRYCAFTSGF